MESAVRCLRDAVAPDETACCLVSVSCDTSVAGCEGVEIFAHLLREHCDFVSAGKAHAKKTILVAAAHAPERYGLPNTNKVAVVNMFRDPHGWLGGTDGMNGIGMDKENNGKKENGKNNPPRLGDVASVGDAIHYALGGDATCANDVDDDDDADDDDKEIVSDTRNTATAAISQNSQNAQNNPKTPPKMNQRGKRSGLWGRAPRLRADTIVALDCVAELLAASGVGATLKLIESLRADQRVCAVVLYHRGGGSFDLDGAFENIKNKTGKRFFAARAIRSAASCSVAVTLPNDVMEKLWSYDSGNSSNDCDSLFFASLDKTHASAMAAERAETPFCEIATVLVRATGRSRGSREAVFATLSRGASRTGLALEFSAAFCAKTASTSDYGDKEKEKHSAAETEAAALSAKLQAAVPFNLGVSKRELLARANVVLPFEHQGGFVRASGDGWETSGQLDSSNTEKEAKAYQSGDFLRYLPLDAGGTGGVTGGGHGENDFGQTRKGAIVYVRDSDDDVSGSDPDSDEELDEDADF
jgi:hypothetical protein